MNVLCLKIRNRAFQSVRIPFKRLFSVRDQYDMFRHVVFKERSRIFQRLSQICFRIIYFRPFYAFDTAAQRR